MPQAPRTPDEWFAYGRDVYDDILNRLSRYGIVPDPRLRFVRGDAPQPYYDPTTREIGFSAPDACQPQGRLWWLFLARILGVSSVDEAMEAMANQVPLLVAHEVVHHLRDHYGAPRRNDFVEEQVANLVGVALMNDHPIYRPMLPRLATEVARACQKLRASNPETAPYLAGFRMEMSDVLVSTSTVSRANLDALRQLGRALDQPVDELVLAAAASELADDIGHARRLQVASEAYFNRHYMANLFEYMLFHYEWIRSSLEQRRLPTLREALESHILTAEWEAAERAETLLFIESSLRHAVDEIAAAAVDALVEEGGADAAAALAELLAEPRPAVQAAALRALRRLGTSGAAAEHEVRALAASSDATVRVEAAALLLARSVTREAGVSLLLGALTTDVDDVTAAAHAAAEYPDDRFVAPLIHLTASPNAGVRASAMRALAEVAATPSVAPHALAQLSDADDEVRAAAVGCLVRHGGPSGAEAIVGMLRDPSEHVRRRAVEAIHELGDDAVAALLAATDGWTVRSTVAQLLCELRPGPAGESRVRGLVREIASEGARLDAARAPLGRRDIELVVRQALAEERQKLSLLAVGLAGTLGSPAAAALAVAGLTSERPDARTGARYLARQAVPDDLWSDVQFLLTDASDSRVASGPGRQRTRGVIGGLADYPSRFIRELLDEFTTAYSQNARRTDRQEDGVLTTIEKLIFLRAVPIFRGVPLEELRPLADDFVAESYAAGERIFDVGDEGVVLYVITSGRVGVDQESPAGGLVQIAQLGPRHVFGETALFNDEPRAARASALETTTVLTLDRDAILRLGSRQPRVFVQILKVMSERLRNADADLG